MSDDVLLTRDMFVLRLEPIPEVGHVRVYVRCVRSDYESAFSFTVPTAEAARFPVAERLRMELVAPAPVALVSAPAADDPTSTGGPF